MFRTASHRFSTRCIRMTLAVLIVGLGADVSVAAAKALFARKEPAPVAASVDSVKPFIIAIDPEAADRQNCREVVVETGDGVRGAVTRKVCRKVL